MFGGGGEGHPLPETSILQKKKKKKKKKTTAEEMDERDREERETGMKAKLKKGHNR